MKKKEKYWMSPCGLDCSRCSIHLRTKEELDYWKKKGVDPDKIRCNGCRSDRGGNHWSSDCELLQCCVYERKLDYCPGCSEFICDKLKKWGNEFKHHKKALDRLKEMKRKGIERWFKESWL